MNFKFQGIISLLGLLLFLNSLIIEEGFLIEILRDFYIYSSDASNLRMGISLNGTDWNFGLFSFKYDVEADFYILSNGSILYTRDMKFLYSRD
jgi:hypothetical protein